MKTERLPIVGVMGSGSEPHAELAQQLGVALARRGVHLLTGGGGGVMTSVSEAFCSVPDRKGRVLGVLPSHPSDPAKTKPGYPNDWVEIPIRTHLPFTGKGGADSMSRNHVNVLSSDVIIALPGGHGTISELQLARLYGRPAIVFGPFGRVPRGLETTDDIAVIDAFLDRHLD